MSVILHFKNYLQFLIRALVISILFIIPFAALQADHIDNSKNQHRLQAVYMYNFLKFVQWPNDHFYYASDTLEICLIGEHFFGMLIESWKTKKIDNKALKIEYMTANDKLDKCQMVFIGRMDNPSIIKILKNIEEKPILTVSVNEQFAQQGGIIGFVMKKNKVRFNINRTQAKKQGLDINSKLLELALSIY